MDERTRTLLPAGELLRDWRQRRHLTQRELAGAAAISHRLLGALESGKVLPNRDIVLRLAQRLDVPLRDRNTLLIAAGHTPAFPTRALRGPELANAWSMIETAVASHMPNPALALDRHWTILVGNDALHGMIAGVDPMLRAEPINWARLTLHPAGLAPRIANLHDWHGYVSGSLRRQFEASGDAVLADLHEEIGDYPTPAAPGTGGEPDVVAIQLRLMTVDGLLSFYTATTQFRAATEVRLSELRIETFYPADTTTADIMRRNANAATILGRPATTG